MRSRSFLLLLGVLIASVPVRAQNPHDAWNYTYYRSTDPGGPVFNWIDIASVGTLVQGLTDDNNVGPFSMGFTFPYYWYGFNTFRIGANGYLTPGNQTSNFAPPFAAFPSMATPNDLIAAMGGDLVFTGQQGARGQCYYWTNNVDSLVVSYIGVTEWESTIDTSATHTFQIILNADDTTIVFQYGEQQGSFSQTNNSTLAIGWENQTGQIGLSYGFSTTPPHPFMPVDGLAVRIIQEPIVEHWIDVGLVGGFGPDNISKVVQRGHPTAVSAVVRNYMIVPLSNIQVTHRITRSDQPLLLDTTYCLDTLQYLQQAEVFFPRTFTPTETGFYVATFKATVYGDFYPGNDSKTTEINCLLLEPDMQAEVAIESGVPGGSIAWPGGGGMGVRMEVPVGAFPLTIDSVLINLSSVTNPEIVIDILEDSLGNPGPVLASRTVTALVGWNRISFGDNSATIERETFFIGVRGDVAFTYESEQPISYRSWQYNGGWAPYILRDSRDVMIRAVVRLENENSVDENTGPIEFALRQNYPNPFNPTTTIEYSVAQRGLVSLKIFNILGEEVRSLVNKVVSPGVKTVTWDGRDNRSRLVSSGIYFCRLQSGPYVRTRRMTLLK